MASSLQHFPTATLYNTLLSRGTYGKKTHCICGQKKLEHFFSSTLLLHRSGSSIGECSLQRQDMDNMFPMLRATKQALQLRSWSIWRVLFLFIIYLFSILLPLLMRDAKGEDLPNPSVNNKLNVSNMWCQVKKENSTFRLISHHVA